MNGQCGRSSGRDLTAVQRNCPSAAASGDRSRPPNHASNSWECQILARFEDSSSQNLTDQPMLGCARNRLSINDLFVVTGRLMSSRLKSTLVESGYSWKSNEIRAR